MQDKYFHTPVSVRLRDVDTEIATLAEMGDYLENWSRSRRGELYELAVKAHEAAGRGYITMEQTRRALVLFASAAGTLRRDLEVEIGGRVVTRSFGGFAA